MAISLFYFWLWYMSHADQSQMLAWLPPKSSCCFTEALKPQKLDILHKLFEAWCSGLGVSSFLLSQRREKEEDVMKSCNAAKAAWLQHFGP